MIASLPVAGTAAGDGAVSSEAGPGEPTPRARLQEIQARWQASDLAYYPAPRKSKPGRKNVVRETNPAAVSLALEMIELAQLSPDDPAVPGAMLFVFERLLAPFDGPPADVERCAIDILIEHHADEPEVARAPCSPTACFRPIARSCCEGWSRKPLGPRPRAWRGWPWGCI